MIKIIVRHSVTSFEKWYPLFVADGARRQAPGATGDQDVYRDVGDPNLVTLVLGWNNADSAHKFLNDPQLGEVMQQAGVVGMPAVVAVTSRA
jgi:hypothetical protein